MLRLHYHCTPFIVLVLINICIAEKVEFGTQNRRIIITKSSVGKKLEKDYKIGNNYFWAAFEKPPSPELRKHFATKGIKFLKFETRSNGKFVYVVKINGNMKNAIITMEKSNILAGLEDINPLDKISPNILDSEKFKTISTYDSINSTIKANIFFYEKVNEQNIKRLCKQYCIKDMLSFDFVANSFSVIASRQHLIDMAEQPEISGIYEIIIPLPCNANARRVTNVDSLQKGFDITYPPTVSWLSGLPYTGDSIWVWNGEPGSCTHIDFFEIDAGGDTLLRGDTVLNPYGIRLKKGNTGKWGFGGYDNGAMGDMIFHGIHTAGTLAGNGWASHTSLRVAGDTLQWRGVAPKSMVLSDGLSGNQGRGDVNSHSFTSSRRPFTAWYDVESARADEALSNHDVTLPIQNNDFNNIGVYAAANQGVRPRYSDQIGYYSLMQNCKNGIIVGAVEASYPYYIAGFSSIGPTRDGRIKPDIVAPGTGLMREGMIIEYDSIAIRSNTGRIKYYWNFDDGTDGFSVSPNGEMFLVEDTSRSGGVFRLMTLSNPYFFTAPIFPNDTVKMDNDDSIFVRLRVSKRSNLIPDTVLFIRLFWYKANDPNYANNVNYYRQKIPSNNSWVNFTLPLNWVTNDTLDKIRFDFGFYENNIVSIGDNVEYGADNGTSMATPHVAGIAALMLQKYNEDVIHTRNRSGFSLNIHQNNCWNSTVRGILIHTATDLVDTIGHGLSNNPDFEKGRAKDPRPPLYGIGPDWVTGWGLVNAVKALEYMDTTKFVEDTIGEFNSRDTFFMYIPSGIENVRTTLTWDDPAATGHQDTTDVYIPKLINDLDLQMISVSTGSIYMPWILDASQHNDGLVYSGGIDSIINPTIILANSASRTTGRRDSLNNVEVVEIDNPQAGLWKIVVNRNTILENQTIPVDPIYNRQDYSLIHDFPIIRDTATTNWHVSSSGAGDVRAISDALALASSGDTVTVNPGTYTITTSDSTNGVTLILRPGVNITFDGYDAFIYVGPNGKIIGAENITISSQVILYNTPVARDPLPQDNVIGMFGNLCRALIVSTPGKTTKVGPGIYSLWNVFNEGLIGVMDADRQKSSRIRLYFGDVPPCAADVEIPSTQKTLIKDMRFEVCDEGKPSALNAWGDEEMEFRNCTFENIDGDGIITSTMISLGDSSNPRTGITRFTNCLFRNFKVGVNAYSCMTQAQSPYFVNTVFDQCETDITFPVFSEAFCHLEANQLHKISVGTSIYIGATAINNLISQTCSGGGLAKQNVTLNNISLVDEGVSDYRPAPRSSLIDNGTGTDDIGANNSDMVYTFSRFLDAIIIFDTGDTLILSDGALVKNTIGSEVRLDTIYTLNLRPVYTITITTNYIDHLSEVQLSVNNSAFIPELPSDYTLFDVKINGYTFLSKTVADIWPHTPITVQVVPDNVQPVPVANVAAAQNGSDVTISWTLNTEPDIVRYKVYRAPNSTPNIPTQLASVNKYTSTYTDPGRTSTGFVYTVIAYDSTGNQSYSCPAMPMRIEMKDNGFYDINTTKPQIKVTNLSGEPISGFKLRVWFSRQEFQGKEIVVDRYYMNPSTITLTKGVHPLNDNIIYVEIGYPLTYQLAPGATTPSEGIQFGVHYTNYYPGQWIKSNDWSSYGINNSFAQTQRVTVYNNSGMLLYGSEPGLNSAPRPPEITVSDVFGFENCSVWSVSQGTMSVDNSLKTQGVASVNFAGGGYQEIISTDLFTVEITNETATMKLDCYVGTTQPNPYWVGNLQIYANCLSAGLNNIWIGQKELTPLNRGQFNTVTFTVPQNVLNVLRGQYTDFSFRILLNTNNSSGPYKLDNMRFE